MTSSNAKKFRVTGRLCGEFTGYPHKGQWRGALMFSLICAWINDWINNRKAGDLRHHRYHYDVTVMFRWIPSRAPRETSIIHLYLPRDGGVSGWRLKGIQWDVNQSWPCTFKSLYWKKHHFLREQPFLLENIYLARARDLTWNICIIQSKFQTIFNTIFHGNHIWYFV